MPVGKLGVFNKVSITDITLRPPACSCILGCKAASGKTVVLGASTNLPSGGLIGPGGVVGLPIGI